MRFFALALLLAAIPSFAKKSEYAPLPAKILAAKTVYIENDSGYAYIADTVYTQLKKWGRYQVVDSKESVDLVFQLSVTHSQNEESSSSPISLYNSKTQSWTYGTVPGGSETVTESYTHLRIIDPKTQGLIWEDNRAWSRKGAATELMQALRSRVKEQEKTGGR